jgi:hypothetical protein
MPLVVPYLVAAMSAWVPPRPADLPRYEAIAADVAEVAFDDAEVPAFEGDFARERTALLLLSIASLESFYRADVDRGDVRGDHGTSWGIMQIHIGDARTKEGWSGKELVADRKKGIRVGLRLVRNSLAWCSRLPLADRLSGYTKGRCEKDSYSRARFSRADNWWKKNSFADFMAQLSAASNSAPPPEKTEPAPTQGKALPVQGFNPTDKARSVVLTEG